MSLGYHTYAKNATVATKALPAPTIFSTNSHSPCRIQATWAGTPDLPSIRVRTGTGGRLDLTLAPTPAACSSTVIIHTRSPTPIRPTASLSVASPKKRAVGAALEVCFRICRLGRRCRACRCHRGVLGQRHRRWKQGNSADFYVLFVNSQQNHSCRLHR